MDNKEFAAHMKELRELQDSKCLTAADIAAAEEKGAREMAQIAYDHEGLYNVDTLMQQWREKKDRE